MASPRHSGRPLARRLREVRILLRAAVDPHRPLLVHIIPMRRCNLACAYCNEYDDHSAPVPAEVMFERIDRLAELGTAVVTISGGEPLLHPELEAIIRRIHDRSMVATLITNGLLLSVERIRSLNAARLDRLQVSIDNLVPDEVSKKSLRVLDRKLVFLAEHAKFEVNINSVVGAGVANPEDALVVARRARELGFTSTLGIIHDGTGHLTPLNASSRAVYDAFTRRNHWSLTRVYRSFQDRLAEGRPNNWRCRAGSRYFYVCEKGLVHYCSQQRGTPNIPLARYTAAHLREAHATAKPCAPYCTVACAHLASTIDLWRSPQRAPVGKLAPAPVVARPLPEMAPAQFHAAQATPEEVTSSRG